MLLASFLLAFACFSSVHAQPPVIPLEVSVTSSSDATDNIPLRSNKQQPAQDNDNTPDSTSDFDDNDGSSDDNAVLPFGNDQVFSSFFIHPSSFPLTRSLGIVPIFVLPAQNLASLCDRIRERAPPIPASPRSQA